MRSQVRSDSLPNHTKRRRFIAEMLQWVSTSIMAAVLPLGRAATAEPSSTVQPEVRTDKAQFMQRAFELSQLAVERGDGYGLWSGGCQGQPHRG